MTASIRKAPALALGDVIGANVTICLVALGVGALIAPLPLRTKVFRYALLGLSLGTVGASFAWNGSISRVEGAVPVLLYFAYVAMIWVIEKKPPKLGEADELEESIAHRPSDRSTRLGPEIVFVLAGLAAMAVGSTVLVEGVRRIAPQEPGQAMLGLTLVGFATGFELVVLAWSTARRGASEAAIAAVVGSFAYNVTMTLGAAALVRPLVLRDAARMHVPFILMNGALALTIFMALRNGRLERLAGFGLLAAYALFISYVFLGARR